MNIDMNMLTFDNLLELTRRRIIFETLVETSPQTVPERVGDLDPMPGFTMERALAECNGPLAWERKKPPKVDGMIVHSLYNKKVTNPSSVHIRAAGGGNIYCKVFERLTGHFDLIIGNFHIQNPDDDYRHLLQDHLRSLKEDEIYRRFAPSTEELIEEAIMAVNVMLRKFDVATALPTLWWMTVFGKPYVEMFGEEKILSAPAFRVEKVRTGQFLVQLTQKPEDVGENFPKVQAVRDAVIDHLGHDAFFDPEKGIDKVYNVPPVVKAMDGNKSGDTDIARA